MMRKKTGRQQPGWFQASISIHIHHPHLRSTRLPQLCTRILLADALNIIIIPTTTITILHHHNHITRQLAAAPPPPPTPTSHHLLLLLLLLINLLLLPNPPPPGCDSARPQAVSSVGVWLGFALLLLGFAYSLTLIVTSSPIPLQFVAPSLLSLSRTTQLV